MGCAKYLACKKCRKKYYLGYGSYSTWFDVLSSDFVNEQTLRRLRGEKVSPIFDLKKNKNMVFAINEHKDCQTDVVIYSPDWTHKNNGHLYLFLGELLIFNIDDYEEIDLWNEKP